MQNTPTPVESGNASTPAGADPLFIEMLRSDWALEMDGAEMYAALAEREKIPERKTIFRKLSELERHHAELWAKRLRDAG